MSVRPSSRSRNTPLPGSKWSGVQVQYTMQSRSEGLSEALASAFRVAARARLAPVSPSETQCRVRIPERCLIHSSEVSIIRESSSLVTTRSGTWNPVAMNSVRGIAVPCGRRPMGQDFAPGPPKQGSHGSRSHPRAVRRRAGRAAPPRRSQAGAGRRQPRGRWGGRGLRTPPHVRGGHRTERAVRLERPHRPERGGDAGVARVRRPGEGHPHASGLLRRGDGLSDGRTVGPRGDMTRQMVVLLGCLTFPLSLFPFPGLSAQKRAITFDDFIALKSVSDPQLSPDGKWVAYTVSTPSLQDNRNVSRVWVVEVATGKSRQLTGGPGSDRQPRWSPDGKTLAFISTRDSGAQVWVLPIAGGDARKVSSLADGASDPIWLPDGSGLLVVSDIKWPPHQEIDQRNGSYPTDARIWTELMWRHWDDFRAGKRQHLFRIDVATGNGTDLTPVDHDVPTIATSGDGDVAVSPDGKDILVAMHFDSTVADNTNVDLYAVEGPVLRRVTTSPGADNTPRYSPDNHWASYLSMERAGFEADRVRLMLMRRNDGMTEGANAIDATAGWSLSVGSYSWCPNSKCVYSVVEERGRDKIYRID